MTATAPEHTPSASPGGARKFPWIARGLFALAVLGVVALALLFYRSQHQQMEQNGKDEVWAVATEKVKQIENWRFERLGDANLISHSQLVEQDLANWLRHRDPAAAAAILVHFRQLREAYHYSDVLAVDPEGKILLSLSGRNGSVSQQTRALLPDSLQRHQALLTDLQSSPAGGSPFMDVIAPVWAGEQSAVGAVVLEIDPAGDFLFPLLREWPLPRRSTETLLIRRDGDHFLVLNEPREGAKAPLRQELRSGELGGIGKVSEGVDYAGRRVLSALIPVRNSPWLLLAKMESAEALAPLRYYRLVLILLVAGLLAALAAGISVVRQRMQREHFRAAYESELARRLSESKYKAIVGALPDLMLRLSAEGICLDCHAPRSPQPTLSPERFPGRALEEAVPPDIAARFRHYIRQAHETQTVQVFEYQQDLDHHPGFFEARLMACEDETLAIIRNITDRKNDENEIRRLLAQVRDDAGVLEGRVAERTAALREANAELESFAYSVSHDLKAPLRGIAGYSRLLESDHADRLNDEGRLFLGYIRDSVAQMSRLIEDLLNYSRVERRALQSVTVDLSALVRSVAAECGAEIERLGAELSIDIPPLSVRADYDGLTMVLRNLLDNAIKFSCASRPPRVEIGASAEGTWVKVWVRDNGIGFDMKFHDRIFDIFQRLNRVEEYPGTGIGLALVRKAMVRMGGRVWAESAPNQGATFYLEIPT